MKRLLTVVATLAALTLAACGDQVEVPTAHVGKILTSEGLRTDLIQPSKFRLDKCFSLCDKLITLEAADYGVKEELRLFMPKDQLNLTVDVRGVFAISANEKNVNRVFARITPKDQNGHWAHISLGKVYATYGQQVVRNTVRSLLIQYTIDEIMANREAINRKLFNQVVADLATTPITVTQFGMADVQPPAIIVKAKELAKTREVAIQRAEAEKQIRLKQAEADLEVAEANKAIRLKKAEAILLENKKVAQSVTTAYLKYRYLEVLEAMAKGNNKVFFPLELSQSTGLQNRMFMGQNRGR